MLFNPCERCGSTEIIAEIHNEKVYCCNCNSTVYCSPELSTEEWNAHNPVKKQYYAIYKCRMCGEEMKIDIDPDATYYKETMKHEYPGHIGIADFQGWRLE